MVTDGQVSELRRWLANGKSLAAAARMASMDKKTARSYRDDERLPSERKSPRNYRTRADPFAEVWDEIEPMLQSDPRLKAKMLFDDLQRRYPGRFEDTTRRTFERRVANWRAIHGPDKAVFFPQDHHPGKFAASDFTVCNSLGVTIAGQNFKHTLFHCALTYSNVESVSLCFSESFEALSEGIQNAFWNFGGVPAQHHTDSLSAAVRDGTFLDRRENILLFGKPGSGKSHALCALAEQLVLSGRSMLFTTCSLLVQQLLVAKRDLRPPKLIKQFSRYEGLIIDDLGYVQQSREEMEVLFTLLAERYERGSVLLTSNLAFSKWDQIFKDAITTAAAIDRLVHHSVIIELNVRSYRVEAARTNGNSATSEKPDKNS